MSKTITYFGYLVIALIALASNFYAHRHPRKLMPLGALITKLMSDRSTRLALFAFWWWVGYHFLYAPL